MIEGLLNTKNKNLKTLMVVGSVVLTGLMIVYYYNQNKLLKLKLKKEKLN